MIFIRQGGAIPSLPHSTNSLLEKEMPENAKERGVSFSLHFLPGSPHFCQEQVYIILTVCVVSFAFVYAFKVPPDSSFLFPLFFLLFSNSA